MKTIGMIGGMSWESTVTYYQLVNRMVRSKLGELHSAQVLLWSFDFAEIEAMQSTGDWQQATDALCTAARNLEQGGAECILICTNTMHKLAPEVQSVINIPLLHIADATAKAIRSNRCKNPLLLATKYTMEESFYTGWLEDNHGISAVIPSQQDRDIVHRIIYQELCQGIVTEESKRQYVDIVHRTPGIDSVIFGCTEVGLLIKATDFSVPCFDTTELHAQAAVEFSLAKEQKNDS